MIAEPRWWKYVILEDVNGVGVVKGFEEGTHRRSSTSTTSIRG